MHPDAKYITANMTGIPRLLDLLYRKRPLVLAYHGIYDGPRRPQELPPTFIHVEDLKAQLKAIRRRYRVLTPDQFVYHLKRGRAFPVYSALITFDDGYESFARLAAPVIESLGMRAVVFVATRFVEDNQPFWFDIAWLYAKAVAEGYCRPPSSESDISALAYKGGEDALMGYLKRMVPEQRDPLVTEMKLALDRCPVSEFKANRLFYPLSPQQLKMLCENGFSAGGHTHSHTILSTLSRQQAWEEIRCNKNWIEHVTGRICNLFAYPNGGEGDFSKDHTDMLANTGYSGGFTLTHRRSLPASNPMEISRINVVPEDTVKALMFRAFGAVMLTGNLRRLVFNLQGKSHISVS